MFRRPTMIHDTRPPLEQCKGSLLLFRFRFPPPSGYPQSLVPLLFNSISGAWRFAPRIDGEFLIYGSLVNVSDLSYTMDRLEGAQKFRMKLPGPTLQWNPSRHHDKLVWSINCCKCLVLIEIYLRLFF